MEKKEALHPVLEHPGVANIFSSQWTEGFSPYINYNRLMVLQNVMSGKMPSLYQNVGVNVCFEWETPPVNHKIAGHIHCDPICVSRWMVMACAVDKRGKIVSAVRQDHENTVNPDLIEVYYRQPKTEVLRRCTFTLGRYLEDTPVSAQDEYELRAIMLHIGTQHDYQVYENAALSIDNVVAMQALLPPQPNLGDFWSESLTA